MSRPSDKQVATWFTQVSESLRSGLGPVESVELADAINSESVSSFRYYLETGGSWEDGLRDHLDFLSETELAICEAASKSGFLAEAMEQLAFARERKGEFKSKFLLSCVYPAFLIHFSILLIPLQKVIDGDFAGYGKMLLSIFVCLWCVLGVSIYAIKSSAKFRKVLFKVLPIISSYKRSRDLSNFCRTLGTAMNAGLPLEFSWALAIRSVNTPRYEEFGESVLLSISKGEPASAGFASLNWLPKNFVSFYKNGERTGEVVGNLRRLADEFEKKAKRSLGLASIAYPKIVLVSAMALAAYQIVTFYIGHLNEITAISDSIGY